MVRQITGCVERAGMSGVPKKLVELVRLIIGRRRDSLLEPDVLTALRQHCAQNDVDVDTVSLRDVSSRISTCHVVATYT